MDFVGVKDFVGFMDFVGTMDSMENMNSIVYWADDTDLIYDTYNTHAAILSTPRHRGKARYFGCLRICSFSPMPILQGW